MALSIYNSAEGGTNGTTVTTANSGGASGTPITTISPGTGVGTITFTNSLASSGNYSYLLTPDTGVCKLIYTFSATGLSYTTGRAYLYFTGYPSGAGQVVYFSGSSTIANLGVSGSNKFITQDINGTLNTGASIYSLNTWYRLELTVLPGPTGTGDGFIRTNVYLGDSVTDPFYSYTTNTATVATTGSTSFHVGKVSSSGTWAPMYIDNIMVQDADFTGPVTTASTAWLRA